MYSPALGFRFLALCLDRQRGADQYNLLQSLALRCGSPEGGSIELRWGSWLGDWPEAPRLGGSTGGGLCRVYAALAPAKDLNTAEEIWEWGARLLAGSDDAAAREWRTLAVLELGGLAGGYEARAAAAWEDPGPAGVGGAVARGLGQSAVVAKSLSLHSVASL